MDVLFKIFFGMLWVLVAVMLIMIFFVAIPSSIEQSNKAQDIAKEMGCSYIGSARDLSSVKFLDCNGEIKMIRIK